MNLQSLVEYSRKHWNMFDWMNVYWLDLHRYSSNKPPMMMIVHWNRSVDRSDWNNMSNPCSWLTLNV